MEKTKIISCYLVSLVLLVLIAGGIYLYMQHVYPSKIGEIQVIFKPGSSLTTIESQFSTYLGLTVSDSDFTSQSSTTLTTIVYLPINKEYQDRDKILSFSTVEYAFVLTPSQKPPCKDISCSGINRIILGN